jgi:hypothetical protein
MDRIQFAMETGGTTEEIYKKLDLAIGTAWDNELEPFRISMEQSNINVKILSQ